MSSTKVSQVSFAGGEISIDMYGRVDDTKYQAGLKRCLNFVSLPQGPVRNRPGFSCVTETKFPDKAVRLVPFIFNSNQTCIIELGDKYARFHTDGGTVMKADNSAPYEVDTPWAAEDLATLHYTQSGDIITIVSRKYEPHEIRRYGWTDWRVVEVVFTAKLPAPTGVTAVRETQANEDSNKDKYTFKYRVSALNADKTIESEPSAVVSVVANLYANGTTAKISWDKVNGASFYRVYKNVGGLYCYIGDTEELSIIDDNIAGKADTTVRRYDTTFAAAGSKPSAVGYFEQRRCFGGFSKDPQRIIMTRSGTEDDLSYSLPTKDDDRVSFQIASREYNMIEHFVPLSHLVVLTSGAEMRISPQNSDAITPKSVSARPQSYNGASSVQPVVVNNSAVYAAARGGHVLDFSYRYDAGGYVSNDLSLRASHFFDFKTIVDMCFSKSPYPIVWCVSSDGSLLGCTYIPDQNLDAWHQHITDGTFESIACVAEGAEDHLYAVIKRTINGKTKRFIERMESFNFESIEKAFFVDCGGTYKGSPTKTVKIPWLEGKTVSILADGAVVPQRVVKNGQITLDVEASTVQVGLPYVSDVQTLPLTLDRVDGLGGGIKKNVYRVSLKVHRSSGIFAGSSEDSLVEHKQRKEEQPGSPPKLFSGDVGLQLRPSWTTTGEILIRQIDPLPIHLLSLTATVSL